MNNRVMINGCSAKPTAVLFGQGVASPGVTFTLAVSGVLQNGSHSNNEAATPFSTAGGTYALTSITQYHSVSGSGFLQITGATLAQTRAVPEPGSIVLLGGGLAVLGLTRRRLRLRRSA